MKPCTGAQAEWGGEEIGPDNTAGEGWHTWAVMIRRDLWRRGQLRAREQAFQMEEAWASLSLFKPQEVIQLDSSWKAVRTREEGSELSTL